MFQQASPPAPAMRLSRKRKLLFAAAMVLVLLALLELAARLGGLAPRSYADRLEHHLLADRQLGFVCEPNLTFRVSYIRGQPTVRTDASGFRVTANPAGEQGLPVVLCLGDSTTFCAEVEDEQTWPSELSITLARSQPAHVVNAALRAYSTVQSARMLDRVLASAGSQTPKVVIFVYCENDLVENVNQITYYPLQAPVMQWRDGAISTIEVDSPAVPWGQSFGQRLAVRQQSWRSWSADLMRQHSALADLVLSRVRRTLGPGQTVRSGPGGSSGPVWPGHPQWPAAVAWAKANRAEDVLVHVLGQMNDRCRQAGTTFIVVEYPVGLREHTADLAEVCRRAGAELLDVSAAFAGPPEQYMAVNIDGSIDGHLNAAGTRTLARAIAPRLLEVLKP